ncbi:MAG TPA: hypothetical protein VLA87_03510 [Gaiellaceae bacterium]|nr:hypothetical protein [Gaiellaceae bacterium]
MICGKRLVVVAAIATCLLFSAPMGASAQDPGQMIVRNFKVLGHHDLGRTEMNGDVWVHGDFAYVGTWVIPCNGRGVKIVDVSKLRHPQLIGTAAARRGTSAEDLVVRRVSTPSFSGDLLAVGIQRCGGGRALDQQGFGLELWNVTDPYHPEKLGEFPVGVGSGGVHELDLFQRGDRVYALLAHPWGEWFMGAGDFFIVDVTNPRLPVKVAEWGAGDAGLSRGPSWGLGAFPSMLGHSARASADGTKAYVSYWDLGVLTFDIIDPANPVLLTRTRYEPWDEGNAHSLTPYTGESGDFILQNDEDSAPDTPADIRYGPGRHGVAIESPPAAPLWRQPEHQVRGHVVEAARQGCRARDYPANTAGKIVVVRTVWYEDPREPLCDAYPQERLAQAAGAVAIVHDFISRYTSPCCPGYFDADIPVLVTNHRTARGMVDAGWARLVARRPSVGYLRVFDAETGVQVAKFDGLPNVHRLRPPFGEWTIHNTEVMDKRAYSSWYSNGIVALDLSPLDEPTPGDPVMVGQFVPPLESFSEDLPYTGMWGVAVREDGVIFASDFVSGLWIVEPRREAAP